MVLVPIRGCFDHHPAGPFIEKLESRFGYDAPTGGAEMLADMGLPLLSQNRHISRGNSRLPRLVNLIVVVTLPQ